MSLNLEDGYAALAALADEAPPMLSRGESFDFVLPSGASSNNSSGSEWLMLDDNKYIVASTSLTSVDVQWLEEKLNVPRGGLFSALRGTDAPHSSEHSYDPLRRHKSMAKVHRGPKGAKTTEHLEVLRVGSPCYGSLAPRRERPNCAEQPYEPMARFAAMARHDDTPKKGAKATEHLAVLRTSDPTSVCRSFGDFGASSSRPLGYKTLGHLREARRQHMRGPYHPEWRSAFADGAAEAPPLKLTGLANRRAVDSGSDDDQLPELPFGLSPRLRAVSGSSLLPAVWIGEQPPLARRPSRDGSESSSSSLDDARSFARTAERLGERSSNDTIASFLDDSDGAASGEWSGRDVHEVREWDRLHGSPPASPSAPKPKQGSPLRALFPFALPEAHGIEPKPMAPTKPKWQDKAEQKSARGKVVAARRQAGA